MTYMTLPSRPLFGEVITEVDNFKEEGLVRGCSQTTFTRQGR
jgi:hypothetical protein